MNRVAREMPSHAQDQVLETQESSWKKTMNEGISATELGKFFLLQ